MEILNHEQGSAEWLKARAGVITGTRLKQVMGTNKARQTLIYQLIAEKIAPLKTSGQTDSMQRGNILEDILKEQFPNVVSVGLVKKNDWLGISPDGLIFTEDVVTEAMENKSPEATKCVEYWLDGGIPDEYLWQCVHYFVVIDTLQKLHFCIFNPEMYDPRMKLKIITVTREDMDGYIRSAKSAISTFKTEWDEALKLLLTKI